MTNRLKHAYLIGILPAMVVLCTIMPVTGKTQVDTVMKHTSADERLYSFWNTAETDLYSSIDSAWVYRSLDTLEKSARAVNDERLFWYCKFAAVMYGGRKFHDLHKEIDYLYSIAGWINKCPLEVIQASYKHKLGTLLYEDRKTAEAFTLLLQAQVTFEKIGLGNIPEIFQYLDELAGTYYSFGDYKSCIQYAELAQKYRSGFKSMYISNINTEALAYNRLNDLTNAGLLFKKAIKAAEQFRDTIWMGIASGNLGYLYMTMGDYKNAIEYLLYDYDLNNKRLPDDAAIAALDLTNCYTKTNNLALAQKYLQEAIRLRAEGKDASFYLTYYRYLYRYYGNTGNTGLAYKYADSALQMSDSINTRKASNLITSTAQRVETETYLSNLALVAEREKNSLVIKNIIIISISLLLVAVLLLVYSRYKSVAKDKKLALQQQLILSAENQVIAEKLHNSENLLNSYIQRISDKNRLIENINQELEALQEKNAGGPEKEKFEKMATLMDATILTEEDWNKFKQLFDDVHPHFFIALKDRVPTLTPAETRLLSLIKLRLSPKEMSGMIGVSQETITKTRYRLRKKMSELNIDAQLEEFVEAL